MTSVVGFFICPFFGIVSNYLSRTNERVSIMKGHRRVKVYEDNGIVRDTEVFLPQIRDLIGFLQGVWDLNMYADCIKGNSKFGDVDASTEVCGHTLHIEFKRSYDDMNHGQIVKAIRQARHSNITTLFVFGMTNRPTHYIRFSPFELNGTGLRETNTADLKQVIKTWANWAEQNSVVTKLQHARDFEVARRYVKRKKK